MGSLSKRDKRWGYIYIHKLHSDNCWIISRNGLIEAFRDDELCEHLCWNDRSVHMSSWATLKMLESSDSVPFLQRELREHIAKRCKTCIFVFFYSEILRLLSCICFSVLSLQGSKKLHRSYALWNCSTEMELLLHFFPGAESSFWLPLETQWCLIDFSCATFQKLKVTLSNVGCWYPEIILV